MKTRLRPFFQQVQQLQQTLSRHLSTRRLPPSNQLWLEARAASRTWEPVLTPEQEESYKDETWVNSKPQTQADEVLMHIFDESMDIGLLPTQELPSIKTNVQFKRTVSTVEATRQITGSLRRVNITDPYLPSARTTPNHEFAIVQKQRSTAQLPPHMRLHEDHSDSPEDRNPVETLINRAIVTFHQEHQRLPDSITVSLIRFYQHWLDHHYHFFTYKAEYGNVQIPIRAGAKGELLTDEVRLD